MGEYINAKQKKYRNLRTSQIPTDTERYRNNWDEIFGKKEEKEKKVQNVNK